MAGTFGNVFSSNTLKIEINTTPGAANEKWVELIETTGASISSDINVNERDVYSDPFTRRTATGGKKFDIKFTSVLSPGNEGHDFLRKIAFSNDITKHNNNEIRFIFPTYKNNTIIEQRTEIYKGVLKFDNVGPGESLDLAKLEYSMMASGEPKVEINAVTLIVADDAEIEAMVKFTSGNATKVANKTANLDITFDKTTGIKIGEKVKLTITAKDGYLINGKDEIEHEITVKSLA